MGVIAFGVGAQIYSKEISISEISELANSKSIMSQLYTATPEAPLVDTPNPTADIAVIENRPETSLKSLYPEDCSFQESELTHYKTSNPSKKGEMIFVLSKERQSECVIDSQNKVVSLDLVAGDSKSVYGQAPFTGVSSDLSKFDLYFQGWKVKPNTPSTRAIRLEEVDYLAAN